LNKKGVTIIELLIYIVLLTIVSLLIGKQFKGLITNYASNKRITRQQSDSRDALGLMLHEIRNTGLKVYLQKTGKTLTRMIAPGTIVSTTDLSSFVHTQGDPCDQLTIYKAQLNDTGALELVDQTRYYVSGTTLNREYISSTGFNTNSVVIENVYGLQFQYGILASNAAIITNEQPLRSPLINYWQSGGTPAPTWGTSSISLSYSAGNSGYLSYRQPMSVTANYRYKVTLRIKAYAGFAQSLNWMQVSFGNSNKTTTYGSERFKPTENPMEILVPVKTSSPANGAYLYIDYSAAGTGLVTLSGMEVRCSQLGAYSWTYTPTVNTDPLTDKINVRAVRMYLLTRTSGKSSVKSSGPISVGEVSVTPSGDYAWQLVSETIETNNNGKF